MITIKTLDFLQRLEALLDEFDAIISWECGEFSDTHGIENEKMTIKFPTRLNIEFPNKRTITQNMIRKELEKHGDW